MSRSRHNRQRSQCTSEARSVPYGDSLTRNLSRAALAWYERYVHQGFRPREARRKALKHPAGVFPQVTPRATSQRNSPRPSAISSTATSTVHDSSDCSSSSCQITSTDGHSSSSRNMPSYKVGIIPEGYPKEHLDQAQQQQLENAIVKELAKGAEQKLMFDAVQHRPGMLIVYCTNAFSENWLMQVTSRLSDWQGKSLKALRGRDIPTPQTVSIFLPRSHDLELKTILQLLDTQNEHINTALWIVVEVRNQGRGKLISVGLDDESRQTIQREDCKLHFGFGQVLVNGLRRHSERS